MNTKKIIALLLALAMIFGMAACSKDENSGEDAAGETSAYSQGIDENGFFEGVTAKDYVALGEYKGIHVPADVYTISAEQVEQEIQSALDSFSSLEEVTGRAARLGDTVDIDYEGYMDGEQFDGGTGNNPSLELGSNSFIAGFEDGIVGHNTGDEFDLELNFPDPYYNNEELSGKAVTFHVTLNSISETVAPELTDAFVAENYDYTTVAELYEGTEAMLRDNAIDMYLFEEIQSYEVSEIPQSMIDYQAQTMLAYYEMMSSMYGMTLDDFVSAMGMQSSDELVAAHEEDLKESAREFLVYQAIAEDAGLSVSQADIDEEFEDYDEETFKDIVEYYGLPYIKCMLLTGKVADLLYDTAVLE